MDEATAADPPDWQFKVIYDREGWARPRLRYFAKSADAEAFIDATLGDHRPELAPLTKLELHWRPVGAWEKLRYNLAAA